jgi:small subunit ribosomal protein S9
MQIINTIGRRKTSIARVYVTPGKGEIIVNDRDLKDYFISEIHQTLVKQALAALKLESSYDVTVNVEGGGVTRTS